MRVVFLVLHRNEAIVWLAHVTSLKLLNVATVRLELPPQRDVTRSINPDSTTFSHQSSGKHTLDSDAAFIALHASPHWLAVVQLSSDSICDFVMFIPLPQNGSAFASASSDLVAANGSSPSYKAAMLIKGSFSLMVAMSASLNGALGLGITV